MVVISHSVYGPVCMSMCVSNVYKCDTMTLKLGIMPNKGTSLLAKKKKKKNVEPWLNMVGKMLLLLLLFFLVSFEFSAAADDVTGFSCFCCNLWVFLLQMFKAQHKSFLTWSWSWNRQWMWQIKIQRITLSQCMCSIYIYFCIFPELTQKKQFISLANDKMNTFWRVGPSWYLCVGRKSNGEKGSSHLGNNSKVGHFEMSLKVRVRYF